MAAPKGNNFWELRSKHGRDKLFATPDLMWKAACEYFQWCVDNPLYASEVVKSGANAGKAFKVPVQRAFTLQGICSYMGCSASYFRAFKSTASEADKDFLTVIEAIEDIIYRQQFEGAAAGLLNANIIARALGLSDKTENKTDVTTNGEKIEAVTMADVLAAMKAKKK